jgi:hypothetical protein
MPYPNLNGQYQFSGSGKCCTDLLGSDLTRKTSSLTAVGTT